MAWSGFPVTQDTDWSAASFLKQLPDAIYERWKALCGRDKTKTSWDTENPYAPTYFYKGYANTPPGIAEDGEAWLIGDNPTGAWAGHANERAHWHAGDPGYWSFDSSTSYDSVYELQDGTLMGWSRLDSRWTYAGHWHRIVLSHADVKGAGIEPPESPQVGDRWIVLAAKADTDWEGHSHTIAEWNGAGWEYLGPAPHCTVACQDGTSLSYNAYDMQWQPVTINSSARFYRYGDTEISFGRMQRDLERIAAEFCDTVTYPTGWDGAGNVYQYGNLNTPRSGAGLRTVDEVLVGGGCAPPDTTYWYSSRDGERWGVWQWPTGAWAGYPNTIATFHYDAMDPPYRWWTFETPSDGHTVEVHHDGSYEMYQDPGQSYYSRQIPPTWRYDSTYGWVDYPSGFARKFPRTICCIGQHGQAGWKARYTSANIEFDWWRYATTDNPPQATPPPSPGTDTWWPVAHHATGAWLGHDGTHARWDGTKWVFYGVQGSDFLQPRRLNGTQAGYLPYASMGFYQWYASYWNNGSFDGWGKCFDYVVEAILSEPPSSPYADRYYAVAFGAREGTEFEGHDGDVAIYDDETETWSFTALPEGATVLRYPGIQGGSWYMHRGEVFYRAAGNWLNMEGMILEHNGTAWQPAADQGQEPDLVETYGWARHGDYIGTWLFNELKAFVGVLKATRRVCRWSAEPDDGAIVWRLWINHVLDDEGDNWSTSTSGPYAQATGPDVQWYPNRGYRGCPWGFNSQSEWYWYEWFPGMHADVQWYFRPYAIGDGYEDFGDGWTPGVENLWRTDTAVCLGSYTYSGGQFLNGTITDPTPYPPGDEVVGYGSNEGFGGNYVVAWFDYVYP